MEAPVGPQKSWWSVLTNIAVKRPYRKHGYVCKCPPSGAGVHLKARHIHV